MKVDGIFEQAYIHFSPGRAMEGYERDASSEVSEVSSTYLADYTKVHA